MKNNHNKQHASASNDSELSWLSFCYVADELDAKTRRQFEIRLEQDQVAREAVAQAFDAAWMLDQALSLEASQQPSASYELPQPESQKERYSNSTRSKTRWAKLAFGLIAASLLAVIIQVQWSVAPVEVTQNNGAASRDTNITEASITLADAWADSDWETEVVVEDAADVDARLNTSDCNCKTCSDGDQDDWMASTLIDMAEDLRPSDFGG